jgi:hypothetical protein
MLKCKVCDHEFTQEELKENHRLVVEHPAPIMGNFGRVKVLDAYNCPKCMVQNTVGERLEEEHKQDDGCTIGDSINYNCFGGYNSYVCGGLEDNDCDIKEKCMQCTEILNSANEPKMITKPNLKAYNCLGDYFNPECGSNDCFFKDKCIEYSKLKMQDNVKANLRFVKHCSSCKYGDYPITKEPCKGCYEYGNFEKDDTDYKRIKLCINCKYLDNASEEKPCISCIDKSNYELRNG